MIYGNKFMNINNYMDLSYQENAIILNEINIKNFLKEIPKRINKIIEFFVKALRKLMNRIKDKKYELIENKIKKNTKADLYKIFAKLKSLNPNYYIEVSDTTIYKPLIDDIVQEMKSKMYSIDEFIELSKVDETDIASEENINKKKDEIEKVRKLPDMIFSKGFINKYNLDSNYDFTSKEGDRLTSDLKNSIRKYIKKNTEIDNLSDFKTFIEYCDTINKAYDDVYDILNGYYKKFIDMMGNYNYSFDDFFEKTDEMGIDVATVNRIYEVLEKIRTGYFVLTSTLVNVLGYYVYLLFDMKDQSMIVYSLLGKLKEDLKAYTEDNA